MHISPSLRQKLVAVVICSLLLATTSTLLGSNVRGDDDSFWESFVDYFRTSQPDQKITKELYKKPAQGISVAVPVIVYHGVRPNYIGETADVKRYTIEPDTLERELTYLRDNKYNVISLGALSRFFDEGVPLPPRPIVLTFDDGWKNQYIYAFPLLKKYGFTATFFIFTSAVGHKNFMTWDEIREMDTSGMTIGGHTRTHPYLTKITDPVALTKEISGGKQVIEDHLGHSIDTFAYPFGLYNATTTREVRGAGYHIARTSKPGLWHAEKNILEVTALYDKNSSSLFSEFIGTGDEVARIFEEPRTNQR